MATRPPVTPAIRELRRHGVPYQPRQYRYVERGGAAASAQALGVDLHTVIKTLIMQDEQRRPLIVLMHGDQEVSTKALARHLAVRVIEPCPPALAERHSGYRVGGTSPFGTRRRMPVYMQKTISTLPNIFINGGKRGLLLELNPAAVVKVLSAELVEVAQT